MKAQVEPIIAADRQSFVCRRFEQASFDHPLHYHHEIELTLITKSRGTRIVGDHVGSFAEGDLCLLGEDLPHIYRNTVPSAEGASSEVLHFSRQCANGFLDLTPELSRFSELLDAAQFGLVFDANVAAAVEPWLVKIRETNGLRRWTYLFEVIDCLLKAPGAESLASPGYVGRVKPNPSERMHHICQYILEHFDEDLSQETLAGRFHMSPAYFSRLFKKTTRKTYTQFLTEVRLGHVCRLLVEADASIVDLAFASGFRNLSNFNRSFRNAYGVSPRDYRKQYHF